ncbi:hypothetical protein [Elongatibacter sediminis]|uniref:O-GlcNAc transferase C-terminal domain-containing protein n=1 Tax=Elongatibacter sediminis TaxID=3119006 RepID=A0AAW9RKN9_9GAMM
MASSSGAARQAPGERRWSDAIRAAEALPAGSGRSRALAHALITRREPGDLERARRALRDWARREPANPGPWRRLLEIDFFEDRLDEADKTLTAFGQRRTGPGETSYFAGILAQRQGDEDSAATAYRDALTARQAATGQPPLGEAALDVAVAMQLLDTASGSYPGSPGRESEGLFNQGPLIRRLETSLDRWEDRASTAERRDRSLCQAHADAWYNLGCAALAGLAGHENSIPRFQRALKLDPDHELARLNIAFALNYSETATPGEIFDAHRQAGRWLEARAGTTPTAFSVSRDPGRRLRIAYLSSDFRQHSVAHFILPVIEAHDAGSFEVIAYHNHTRTDAMTRRIQTACHGFHPVASLSDEALRQRIMDDGIDILIDLNGLTQGHRMALLARRVAPLQLTWLGYPNTTGLSTVDYRIVDAVTDPPGDADGLATERLLRLPGNFSVFRPPAAAPDAGPSPCLQSGQVTFGSFNAMPKLNPPLLQSWAAILRAVPASRLLLKNLALGHEAPRRQVAEIFARSGVAPERLEFAGPTADQAGHLAHYHRVDITLDSFPYNGTTTTCESLFMGVPVLSRAGTDHRSRVGASLLSGIGLESLVASGENSFLELATEVSAHPDRLVAMRAGLRKRLLNSSLANAQPFTTELESALREIWARWCKDEGRT